MIKQGIFAAHWKEKLEKFNMESQVNTLCESKEENDGLIHRIKHLN